MIHPRAAGWPRAALALALSLVPSAGLAQPPPTVEADTGETTLTLTSLTRAERWRYFEPSASAGREPDYAFLGSRFNLAVAHREGRWRARAGLQYVRIEPLPERAIGPGPLGSGGLYQFHAESTFSYQVYFRELALGAEVAPGVEVSVGRLTMKAAPAPSGSTEAIDTLRPRVDGRLLGGFAWSMYERAFDGVRLEVSRPGWRLHTMAAMPSQGGYEESANLTISGIQVASAQLALGDTGRRETTLFAYGYRDRRDVRVRPDNTLRMTRAADVTIWTGGVSHLGVATVPSGEIDLVVWAAGQVGQWYELDHRAWSVAAEAGHQWSRAPGRPWARAGVLVASGDADGSDGRHTTFFPMLPDADGRGASLVSAPMNLVDVFGELILQPHARLHVSTAIHRVALASPGDRWYDGSGATMREGGYFGYSTRLSGGHTGLALVAEASADLTISRYWTLRAHLSRTQGGDVVRHNFAGDRLTFLSVESVVRF